MVASDYSFGEMEEMKCDAVYQTASIVIMQHFPSTYLPARIYIEKSCLSIK